MNQQRMPLVNLVFTILMCCCIQIKSQAETYYCWAMSGLLVRDEPKQYANVIGKLDYGQKIEISDEYRHNGIFHKVEFLPGLRKKEESTDDIYLEDYWVSIEYNNVEGFVFAGYLSRWPTFNLIKKSTFTYSENLSSYLIRAFGNNPNEIQKRDTNYFDNITRSIIVKPGIGIIDFHSEKGFGGQYVFTNLTMNEALLLVYHLFSMHSYKLPSNPEEVNYGEHYFGISYTDENIEINFPEPGGTITIQKIEAVIVVTYFGSC